jgi:heme/copper-type cytochrome/quinol oxidase subunit 4
VVSRATRTWSFVNAGWLAFIWITRIRNAVDDHTSSTANHAIAYVLSAICLVGAAALAVVAWRRLTTRAATNVIVGVAAVHVGIWLVRGVQIAISDREFAFKAVHVTLGVISVALAVMLVRSVRSSLPWDSRSASSRSTPSAVGSSATS